MFLIARVTRSTGTHTEIRQSGCVICITIINIQVKSIMWQFMMAWSNANIFRVTGPLCEFPTQGPVTRSFDVFFDLPLNKQLSKQSWVWWFATLSRPLWRHSNVLGLLYWCIILSSKSLHSIQETPHFRWVYFGSIDSIQRKTPSYE